MRAMHAEVDGPASARIKGLELVKGWTVAVAVGALGLTGVLGLAAADTFHGRTLAQPASTTDGTTSSNDATSPSGSGLAPQAPANGTFGGGTQPPAVVSGGS